MINSFFAKKNNIEFIFYKNELPKYYWRICLNYLGFSPSAKLNCDVDDLETGSILIEKKEVNHFVIKLYKSNQS